MLKLRTSEAQVAFHAIGEWAKEHAPEAWAGLYKYLNEYGCSTGEGKLDPERCHTIVWPNADTKEFGVVWEFRKPDGTYEFWMNGAAVLREPDDAHPTPWWSVHT